MIAVVRSELAGVGYHQATTRAIAKRAGVADGTLYRHYPDKRSLFFAAVLAEHQPVLDWMEQLPGRAGTAPLIDILTDAMAQLWQLRRTVLPLELALAADPDQPRGGGGDLAAPAAAGGPPRLLATLLGLAANPTIVPGTTQAGAGDRSMLRAAVALLLGGIARDGEPDQR